MTISQQSKNQRSFTWEGRLNDGKQRCFKWMEQQFVDIYEMISGANMIDKHVWTQWWMTLKSLQSAVVATKSQQRVFVQVDRLHRSIHARREEPQSDESQRRSGERRDWWPGEGESFETHQTRSGPGHFGGAGRSTERRLDISRDADSPLPELDTFLRLCVKPLPAFSHPLHSKCNFQQHQKKWTVPEERVCRFPLLGQNAPKPSR